MVSEDKKGAQMAIGTLVTIVLAVVVLVVIVLGFTMGWNNLWGKIGLAGSSDLTSFTASCRVAATSEAKGAFCEKKSVEINGKSTDIDCSHNDVVSSLEDSIPSSWGAHADICK